QADQGQARSPVRPGCARVAPEEGVRPARVGAAAGGGGGGRRRARLACLALEQEARGRRAGGCRCRSSRSRARTSPRRGAGEVRGLVAERIPIAFLAGLVSVITPCVLPLVPGYLSAVSAVEATRLGERGVARRVLTASLPFILGFTVVFVALGAGAAAI